MNKKVPYKLIINTNSYTGNFERELMAYCFGRLSNSTGGFTAYARPFWDQVVGTGVETYENYMEIQNGPKVERPLYAESIRLLNIRRGFSEEEAVKKAMEIEQKVRQKMKEESILRVYDEYLCFTLQEVDDWEEVTFYNICCYNNDECNAIYVQLNKPLNEYFENIIIPRIINFFETDAYNKIKAYEWFCRGYDFSPEEPFVLKDLILIDENGNIVKDYLNTKE